MIRFRLKAAGSEVEGELCAMPLSQGEDGKSEAQREVMVGLGCRYKYYKGPCKLGTGQRECVKSR